MGTPKWRRENADKLRLYRRVWYAKNRQHALEVVKKRKTELKAWVKKYKRKLSCSICGETHPACIEFHHKDPVIKEIGLSRVGSNGWSIKKIEREIAKCQVVCSNCHKKIHNKGAW